MAWNKTQLERKLNDADRSEFAIMIKPLKVDRTLTITDTGTGMTQSDLVATVRCGTKQFVQAGDDLSTIVPYGCGFYSAYLIVEKVVVITKHKDDEQYICESHADGSFSITRDVNGEQLGRGTKITLFLREDQVEYLEERRIKDLVTEHCGFISYPIYLCAEKAAEQKEGNFIGEDSYEWQLIWEQKRSGPPNNKIQLAGPIWASNEALCKRIKGMLGEKVGKVIIGPESSFGDSSTTYFRITRKGILEINPYTVEELRELVHTRQQNAIAQLLFEAALSAKPKKALWKRKNRLSAKPKKALWKRKNWVEGLNLSCAVLQLIAAAFACVSSG